VTLLFHPGDPDTHLAGDRVGRLAGVHPVFGPGFVRLFIAVQKAGRGVAVIAGQNSKEAV
jgi:hypothetical protein